MLTYRRFTPESWKVYVEAIQAEAVESTKEVFRRKADLWYPTVYVVDEATASSPELWEEGPRGQRKRLRTHLVSRRGIPKLNGLEVLQNLRGEMDEADELLLYRDVLTRFAARLGLALNVDEPPQIDESGHPSMSFTGVPIEKLNYEDGNRWIAAEGSRVLKEDAFVTYTIPNTEKVEAYLKAKHGEV